MTRHVLVELLDERRRGLNPQQIRVIMKASTVPPLDRLRVQFILVGAHELLVERRRAHTSAAVALKSGTVVG